MKFKILPLLLLLFLAQSIKAQEKYTISGIIKDAATGETIIGATIYAVQQQTGTVTNEYGFYSLTLPKDSVYLQFSYVGLKDEIRSFYLGEDTRIDLELSEGLELQTAVVLANSNREKVNSTQMGVDEISVKEAKEIPAIFGEVDVIKVLQLKPGVQSGGEGTSGLYVRGGGPDQNFFVLDEAPVYNPSHLFGFFSTFNADATKNVTLYKSGFPSKYGGKLSSVIDVNMREGNKKRFSMSGGLGLISSRLTLEGPIIKDKMSFIVSGRRTYVDLFTKLLNKANEDKEDWNKIPDYSFYDLNAKINYELGPKDRLYLSGYFGRDVFLFKDDVFNFNFNWGNATGTVRWNHIISPKLFVNTSFTFSDYLYQISNSFDQFSITLGSGIRDMNLKSDFTWMPHPKHDVRFGANAIYHRFLVNSLDGGNGDDFQLEAGSKFHAGDFALYISDDWEISNRIKVLGGIRLSGFLNEGKFYHGIEPRLATKFSISDKVSLKASYARMQQYLHLVSPSGASLPTDVWYPSNPNVAPQQSDLVSLGTAWAISKDWFFSGELYYKWLHNQIDFRDGAQLFVNDDLDKEFIFGSGYGYGGEIYLEKKNGPLRGWIGYTLSWSWRKFDQVMDGRPYHPSFDRRHDISAVFMSDIFELGFIKNKWPNLHKKVPVTFSLSWVYGTGQAISLPVARYFSSDYVGENPFNFVPVYTDRNAFRMPAYHRLDMGLVFKLKPMSKKRFKSDLTVSVYNLYNRRNPYFMYIQPVYADDNATGAQVPERFQAKVVSLFPIIPSITWNFKF